MSEQPNEPTAPAPNSVFARIESEDREAMRAAGHQTQYTFGQPIVHEDEAADGVYVVLEGQCRVLETGLPAPGMTTSRIQETTIAMLGPGALFGAPIEGLALRSPVVRAASAGVRLLHVPEAGLERLLAERPRLRGWLESVRRSRAIAALIQSNRHLRDLPPEIVEELSATAVPLRVSAGDIVYEVDDEPGPLYLVRSGWLVQTRQTDDQPEAIAYPRAGDLCGVSSCASNRPRTDRLRALSDADLLALAPRSLRALCDASPALAEAIERLAISERDAHPVPMPLDVAELPRVLATAEDEVIDTKREAVASSAVAELGVEHAGPTVEHPFQDPQGYFRSRGRTIKRFPYVRQVDEADCGVACLAMIFRYYGKSIGLARIRALAGATIEGTPLFGLCRAATELGLAARPVRVSRRNLDKLPLPAIAHWKDHHWVVVLRVTARRVRIADPAVGDIWVPREEFEEHWNGFCALFDFTEAFEDAKEDSAGFRWIVPHFVPYAGILGLAAMLAFVVALLALVLPVLSQVIIDRVVIEGAQGSDLLSKILVVMLVLFSLITAARVVQGYLMAFIAVRIDASVFDMITRRLLSLPISYFLSRRTGDIHRRIAGARELRRMVVSNAIRTAVALVQLMVALGLMLVYSSTLTLVYVASVPLYLGLMLYVSKVLRPLFSRLEEEYASYESDQLDGIKGIEAIKAAAAEATYRASMLERFLKATRFQFRADHAMLFYDAGLQAVGYLSQGMFLFVGALLAIDGQLTLGGFVAFNALVAMTNGAIFSLMGLWDEVQKSIVLMNRLSDVFETEPEQGNDRSHLLPVRTLSGAVELRRVDFRYSPDSDPVIDDLSLRVSPGERIAIVGRSGCGKTTLVKLLAGLLEPTEGKILYDGIAHDVVNQRQMRQRIGVVLQDNHMFSGTIIENIALGEQPDAEQAMRAARAADAHDFISRLPLAYRTVIGENGVRLSGGQAQRIAIARALYKDPCMFLLDEATSALDTESERTIQANLWAHFAGKTVFVIAHRLSTVRDADRILVMERGRILEEGTHEQLTERRGLYYELASRQVEQ